MLFSVLLQVEITPSPTPSCRPWHRSKFLTWRCRVRSWEGPWFAVRGARGGVTQGTGSDVATVSTRYGPVGLVHVDAHTDTGDRALGEQIHHGAPFRRCVEEGLLDCARVVQIGLRGSSYDPDPYKYCRDQVSAAASPGS